MGQKPTTTFPDYATTQRAGGGNSAGPLLENLTLEFVVGEERRCLARFMIDEIGLQAFVVMPKALRVIGGHDLLWNAKERFVPLPLIFDLVAAASDGAMAWATAYNETCP